MTAAASTVGGVKEAWVWAFYPDKRSQNGFAFDSRAWLNRYDCAARTVQTLRMEFYNGGEYALGFSEDDDPFGVWEARPRRAVQEGTRDAMALNALCGSGGGQSFASHQAARAAAQRIFAVR